MSDAIHGAVVLHSEQCKECAMHHVIIGTGPAGIIAAETLRKYDPHNDITVIGDEPEPPYSRMAIPYFLHNKIDETGTHLRKRDQHYDQLAIQLLNQRVLKVNPNDKTLSLNNSTVHSYNSLIVATGSRPILPPIEGMDLPGVHNCWTLKDARSIAALAQPNSRVLLIGAGFIGCIVLEALALRGVELTVVEMGDRMVPRMMNQEAGNLIKTWCVNKGINVHTSTGVTSVQRDDDLEHPLIVNLNSGEKLEVDLVISAAGVRSNTEFLQSSGIETDQGILVDHHLKTNFDGIYAAGDVAQGRDFSTGSYQVHAIQPTASEHGRISAMNIAGDTHYYRGSFNMNVLDTLGLISSSFGLWMGVENGDRVTLFEPDRFRYLNLEFEGDVMVGATSVGLTQHVGVLRGLIQNRFKLGVWKDRLIRDPSRIMEAYLAKTQLGHHR